MRAARLLLLGVVFLAACGADPREVPLEPDQIWDDTALESPVEEPIRYVRRTDDVTYGLPRAGREGIADLLALFPREGLDRTDPNIFSSAEMAEAADRCADWSSQGLAALPMEIEAVVTLHPRQYQKIPVCDQDERHYGTYTIEDDTGGLLVLRDSRVAPFTYGDRVKLTVHAIMLTFGGDLDTRAILVADVEPTAQKRERDPETGADQIVREILYSRKGTTFDTDDVAQVKQVEGYVLVPPTNANFNAMIVSDKPFPRADSATLQGERLQCVRNCEAELFRSGSCPASDALGPVCRSLCDGTQTSVNPDDLPTCWQVGIDAELGRRGFAPGFGTRLRATGPVVNSFDYQMWVLSLGQIEILEAP